MRNLTLDVKSGAIKVYTMEAHQLAHILGKDPRVIKRVTPLGSDVYEIEVIGDVFKARRADKQPFDPKMAAELMQTGWVVGNFE